MTIRLFILLLSSTLLVSCNSSERRPNIIVILVDDIRWDEFGVAGHNYIKTPNIDHRIRMWENKCERRWKGLPEIELAEQ